MDLVLTALPGESLDELGASIARESGVEVLCLEGDLSEASTLEELASLASSTQAAPDLLINNAGIGRVESFAGSDPDYIGAMVRLNAEALLRLTRRFLDWGVRRRRQVLNVASLGALFPMPTLAAYSATKSLVLNASLALREELAGEVGVTVLCPNAIRTTPEVEAYVEGFGLLAKWACQKPELVARAGLDGAERNRAVVIPGAFNKALAAAGRLAPRAMVMRAIRACWGGFGSAGKEADHGSRS